MARRSDEDHIRNTHNLARFCTENRSIAWVLLFAVLGWGFYGYSTMPKSKDPSIPVRIALVKCPWPGVSAEKVEQLVTRPIEQTVAASASLHQPEPGSKYALMSLSLPGLALVRVQLAENVGDPVQPFNEINLALDALNSNLPDGAGPIQFNSHAGETAALMLTVASPPENEIQVRLRARDIEAAIRAERAMLPLGERGDRAAFVMAFPRKVSSRMTLQLRDVVADALSAKGVVRNVRPLQGSGFVGFDASVGPNSQQALLQEAERLGRLRLSSNEIHPDAWLPIVVRDPGRTFEELAAVAGPRYSYAQLDDATALISRTLASVPEVSRIQRVGVLPEQIWLAYSQDQFASYGLEPSNLKNALAARNITAGAGMVEAGDVQLFLEPSGAFTKASQIGGVAIAFTNDKAPVYLRDLVEIVPGYQSPPRFLNFYTHRDAGERWHRSPAITLAIDMRDGQQIGDFGENVDAALELLEGRLPDGLILGRTSDQPRQVRESIDLFMTALYEAIILVVIVAWIGFREWRAALLMSISMPLTLAMTFGIIAALGVELQQVSIATLIIALGLLVDDPVVAGDSIKRSLAAGHPREVAAWLGPTKLAGAILFATITNIVAYLPFLLLSGNTGDFLRSLPIVMATTLICSRVVSMTFVPLLGYYLLRPSSGEQALEQRRSQGFTGRYYRIAAMGVDRRKRVFGLSLLVIVLGFGWGSTLSTAFFPKDVQYLSYIDVLLPSDAPVGATNRAAVEVEKIVREIAAKYGEGQGSGSDRTKVLKSITSFVGSGGPRFWSTVTPDLPQNNYAELLLEVYDKEFTPALVGPLQRAVTARIPGAIVQVRQLSTNPVAHPIAVEISGRADLTSASEDTDIQTLRSISEKTQAILRGAPGVGNVYDDWLTESFRVKVQVDPDRANEAGVTNADVAQSVAGAVSGTEVGSILRGDKQIPIVVRLRMEERGTLADLQNLYVYSTQNRNKVPLLEVAQLDYRLTTQRFFRREQFRTITVIAYPQPGVLTSEVLKSVADEVKELQRSLPPGYKIQMAGEIAQQETGFQQLSVIMLISVAAIFLALVVQFNSAIKPILVFAAVPYGIVGALVALQVMGVPFGFMAFLGIASLVGVIVSHVIVLFDFVEEMREEGVPVRQALLDAGLERLRPVMITVGATVLALVPLAVHGGPLWQPLCYAQIGGLSLATFIELLLVPILYAIFVLDLKIVRWGPRSIPSEISDRG
jgi:multidrug efflux pump subunit AcrB